MSLNKTACRRLARVATRATSAANSRTKALVSITPGKTSKTSSVQARKSTKNCNSPKVPRQTPRHQEVSEWGVGEEENVSSDEAVEGKTSSVGSAQGRVRFMPRMKQEASIRLNIFQYKQGTKSIHVTLIWYKRTGSQPPLIGVWPAKTELTTGGHSPLTDVTVLLCMWRTNRQPPLFGVSLGS